MSKNKLHLFLPLVQVLAAILLTTTTFLRHDSINNPAWRAPGRQICDAVNAPAALIKFCILQSAYKWFLFHPVFDFAAETFVYFGIIAMLWYLVSLEVSSGDPQRRSVITQKMGARKLGDVLLICFGFGVGFFGEQIRNQQPGFYSTAYWNTVSAFYFLWAAILVAFYGHDLWLSITFKSRTA